MLAVWAVFSIWQPCLFNDKMSGICTVLPVTWMKPVKLYVAYIHAFITHICMSEIWHICPIWWANLFLHLLHYVGNSDNVDLWYVRIPIDQKFWCWKSNMSEILKHRNSNTSEIPIFQTFWYIGLPKILICQTFQYIDNSAILKFQYFGILILLMHQKFQYIGHFDMSKFR